MLASPSRLAAVHATGLLEPGCDPDLARLTALAVRCTGAPVSLLSMLIADRQIVKSAVGLPPHLAGMMELPIASALCVHVVETGGEPLVLGDARLDPVLRHNDAVRVLGAVAYAAMPIVARGEDGAEHVVGSLCAIDVEPRAWDPDAIEALAQLARVAGAHIALRQERDARERAEATLRQSEARLAEAQQVGRIGSWVVDVATHTASWSDELFRVMGRDPRDGAPSFDGFIELVHPDDRAHVLSAIRTHSGSPSPLEFEYRVRHADHGVRLLRQRLENRFDEHGAWRQVIGIAQDVTEQAAAAEQLRRSERYFRALIEHTSELITVLDASGQVRYGSPAVLELLGCPPGEDVTGRDGMAVVHHDDRPAVDALFREMLAEPRAVRRAQYRVRHRDGSWRVMSTIARNLLDEPAVAGIVVNSRDMTKTQLLEDRLRHAQKMEAVGQLAGGVAHDFNNLLTVIGGCARLVRDALPADAGVHEELDAVLDATGRAAQLTQQLLAFGRKQMLQPRVLDLSEAVAGVTPLLRRLIDGHVTIATALAPGLPSVFADPGQVEQVLVNLTVNARDAMPQGGRLHIGTSHVTLSAADVAARGADAAPGVYVRLTVRDTGVGMSEATLARAFEPFFTTKEQGKGTGLGLATVYGIVRQSGGHVRVTSAAGKGTTFEIDFPTTVDPDTLAADAGAGVAVEPEPTPETVLLVEDNEPLRLLVRRVLTREGYTVLEAEHGNDALRVVAEHQGRIDLALTDVMMPELGGRALAERLRVERPDVRVLFMSGYTDDEMLRRGLLEQGVALVQKPFTPDRLLRAVREALATRS